MDDPGMPDDMPITAIAPWFGGKRGMSHRIVAELGPHRVYWGLCCGSLAVEMAKPACVMETVVDLHGDLTNLARVLAAPRLRRRLHHELRWCLMSDGVFEDSARIIRASAFDSDAPDTERARHYLLTVWLGRNGVAGTSNYNSHFCVRYTANGGHAAKRWAGVLASIEAWGRRLSNVTILRRDVFDVLERIEDRAGTVIYADPPYLVKGASYVHDFTTEDHARFALALRHFAHSRVVVSYYADARLAELYPGWVVVDCARNKALASQGQRDRGAAVRAPEVLLINGESYTVPHAAGLFAGAPHA